MPRSFGVVLNFCSTSSSPSSFEEGSHQLDRVDQQLLVMLAWLPVWIYLAAARKRPEKKLTVALLSKAGVWSKLLRKKFGLENLYR
jgi:hypothetical protein